GHPDGGSAGAAAEVSGIGVKGVEVDDGERGGEVLGVAVPWGSGQVVCRPLGERRVSAHAFQDLTKPIRYARNWSPRGRSSSTIGREEHRSFRKGAQDEPVAQLVTHRHR